MAAATAAASGGHTITRTPRMIDNIAAAAAAAATLTATASALGQQCMYPTPE